MWKWLWRVWTGDILIPVMGATNKKLKIKRITCISTEFETLEITQTCQNDFTMRYIIYVQQRLYIIDQLQIDVSYHEPAGVLRLGWGVHLEPGWVLRLEEKSSWNQDGFWGCGRGSSGTRVRRWSRAKEETFKRREENMQTQGAANAWFLSKTQSVRVTQWVSQQSMDENGLMMFQGLDASLEERWKQR